MADNDSYTLLRGIWIVIPKANDISTIKKDVNVDGIVWDLCDKIRDLGFEIYLTGQVTGYYGDIMAFLDTIDLKDVWKRIRKR